MISSSFTHHTHLRMLAHRKASAVFLDGSQAPRTDPKFAISNFFDDIYPVCTAHPSPLPVPPPRDQSILSHPDDTTQDATLAKNPLIPAPSTFSSSFTHSNDPCARSRIQQQPPCSRLLTHSTFCSKNSPHVFIVPLFDATQPSSCHLYTLAGRTHSHTPALLGHLSDPPVPQDSSSLAQLLCYSHTLFTHTHPRHYLLGRLRVRLSQ
jgi:hypothetical protein